MTSTSSQYPRTRVCSSSKLWTKKAEEWSETRKWVMLRRFSSPNLIWKRRWAFAIYQKIPACSGVLFRHFKSSGHAMRQFVGYDAAPWPGRGIKSLCVTCPNYWKNIVTGTVRMGQTDTNFHYRLVRLAHATCPRDKTKNNQWKALFVQVPRRPHHYLGLPACTEHVIWLSDLSPEQSTRGGLSQSPVPVIMQCKRSMYRSGRLRLKSECTGCTGSLYLESFVSIQTCIDWRLCFAVALGRLIVSFLSLQRSANLL